MVTRRIFLLWVVLHTFCAGVSAAEPPALEYQVKAAFILNFAKFVEWPAQAFADAEAPLSIGIFGEDPFGEVLDQMSRDSKLNGRSVVIRRSRFLHELENCQILFFSRSEEASLVESLEALKGSSVLTVGESENFAERSGVIGFVRQDNKVRFEINLASARRAQLKISSKLLSLASEVIE